ncbi:MAG: efflux RND transporter periplasmic adaptor subunit [Verrucomicrobia bacterium]|nr:efflux RND transporter periplasmic adaptor subunit [Verrucomicrobiota bacterium]
MNNHPQPVRYSAADHGGRRLLRLGVAAVACGFVVSACAPQRAPQAAPPPPEVAVVTVAAQRVVLTTELPGRASPYRIAEIRPQVNGLIQKRLFAEGGDVEAGQALYQIDPAPFQAALNNARAALGRAEASLPAIAARAERFRDLVADKAVSQQNLDDAAAALRQTEADIQFYKATLENARINLGYTRVVAPISGRIGSSAVTDGAIVTAYQPVPLATIQQLDPIYVDVPQSTNELLRLQRRLADGRMAQDANKPDAVRLILEDGTPYPHEGTLQFRDISVDRSTGAVTLRMVFPNPQGVLLPGMFVRTAVKEGVNEKGILVPQPAVMRDPKGNPFSYVVDAQGLAQPRPLKLDRAIGSNWLVSEGLAPGDKVIVEGLQRVRPGSPVRLPMPPAKAN